MTRHHRSRIVPRGWAAALAALGLTVGPAHADNGLHLGWCIGHNQHHNTGCAGSTQSPQQPQGQVPVVPLSQTTPPRPTPQTVTITGTALLLQELQQPGQVVVQRPTSVTVQVQPVLRPPTVRPPKPIAVPQPMPVVVGGTPALQPPPLRPPQPPGQVPQPVATPQPLATPAQVPVLQPPRPVQATPMPVPLATPQPLGTPAQVPVLQPPLPVQATPTPVPLATPQPLATPAQVPVLQPPRPVQATPTPVPLATPQPLATPAQVPLLQPPTPVQSTPTPVPLSTPQPLATPAQVPVLQPPTPMQGTPTPVPLATPQGIPAPIQVPTLTPPLPPQGPVTGVVAPPLGVTTVNLGLQQLPPATTQTLVPIASIPGHPLVDGARPVHPQAPLWVVSRPGRQPGHDLPARASETDAGPATTSHCLASGLGWRRERQPDGQERLVGVHAELRTTDQLVRDIPANHHLHAGCVLEVERRYVAP